MQTIVPAAAGYYLLFPRFDADKSYIRDHVACPIVAWEIKDAVQLDDSVCRRVKAIAHGEPNTDLPQDQFVLSPDGVITSSSGIAWSNSDKWLSSIRNEYRRTHT